MAKEKKKITPKEFAQRMLGIRAIADEDPETGHWLADDLMCEILKENGFKTGVDRFKRMPKR